MGEKMKNNITKRIKSTASVTVLGMALSTPGISQGAIVNFELTGIVVTHDLSVIGNADPGLSIGDTITLTGSYDGSNLDPTYSSGFIDAYALQSSQLTFGNLSFNDNDYVAGDLLRLEFWAGTNELSSLLAQYSTFIDGIDLAFDGSYDWQFYDMTTSRQTMLTGAWDLNSFTTSSVPVPAAVWLFGSGLIGLIGVARRKKA